MNTEDVRIGSEVTWGTGVIRAKVLFVFAPATGECKLELIKAYKTPCGMVVPEGSILAMPISEIRSIV
jgi:hypothetical protein